MRQALVLVIATALLAITTQTAVSSSSDTITLWGGPGSVTINGKPAPPDTFIWAGLGPDPQEFPNIDRLGPDGSWRISFPTDWERVHLYVDGFRVPAGPWDEAVPGVAHEMRLDVGADTDPEPVFLIVHAKRNDMTLFGQAVEPDAMVCSNVDDHWYACSGVGPRSYFSLQLEPGLLDVTFTINSFPVNGPSYDALPELAPFWITLHAGDPERPAFEFYGLPGNVDGALSDCEISERIFVHGLGDDGWESNVIASPDGSWSLSAPSGTTGIQVYASRHWNSDEDHIPFGSETYKATPYGGRQRIDLNFKASGWYILPAIDTPATDSESVLFSGFHRSTKPRTNLILGLVVGKLFRNLDWSSPRGRTSNTAWFDAPHPIGTKPGVGKLFRNLDWSWMLSPRGRTCNTAWFDAPRDIQSGLNLVYRLPRGAA